MPMPRCQIPILIVAGFSSRLPRYSQIRSAIVGPSGQIGTHEPPGKAPRQFALLVRSAEIELEVDEPDFSEL